jgi:hypothetical protein
VRCNNKTEWSVQQYISSGLLCGPSCKNKTSRVLIAHKPHINSFSDISCHVNFNSFHVTLILHDCFDILYNILKTLFTTSEFWIWGNIHPCTVWRLSQHFWIWFILWFCQPCNVLFLWVQDNIKWRSHSTNELCQV